MQLGEKQTLTVVKQVEFGVYLAQSQEEAEKEKVLLPRKQTPEGVALGDRLEVFLYKDSDDRLIATVRTPKITLRQTAYLTVRQIGKIGAFLDWGLEKDLLLPFREQTAPVSEGQTVLAALYIDKSERLCATMNVYEYLSCDSPYQRDDSVEATVYQISDRFGAFAAVDGKYSALIPKKELFGRIRIGDRLRARVARVREDGKLDLSVRDKAYLQIGADAEKILTALEERGGALPFTDKASPEVLDREMGMSKNEFKRAVGRLLKEGKIRITERAIVRKN